MTAISRGATIIINDYYLQPIEFAFFYLIPAIILLSLCCSLWLVYWFLEQKAKIKNTKSKRILTIAVAFSIIALACTNFGYLIMYAGNKSLSAEVGLGLVMTSAALFPAICGLFLAFYMKKEKKLGENEKKIEGQKQEKK